MESRSQRPPRLCEHPPGGGWETMILLNSSQQLHTEEILQSLNLVGKVSRIQLQQYFLEYLKTAFEDSVALNHNPDIDLLVLVSQQVNLHDLLCQLQLNTGWKECSIWLKCTKNNDILHLSKMQQEQRFASSWNAL